MQQLEEIGLGKDLRHDIHSKFTIQWTKVIGKDGKKERKVLYLWHVHHHFNLHAILNRLKQLWVQSSLDRHKDEAKPYTGCIAHVEVMHLVVSGRILRIRGYFDHNDACKKNAQITNAPQPPLHPDVTKNAMDLLNAGMPLATMIKTNIEMYDRRTYPDMPKTVDGLASTPFRWSNAR